MRIIINGTECAGKTTIANMLSKKLNIPSYSGGDMRREIAREKGITIMELNRLGEKEDWTDKEVDAKLIEITKTKKDFVISSRTLPYLVKDGIINIFLDADLRLRAERVVKLKRKEEPYKNVEEAMKFLEERRISDAKRYKKIYGIDTADMSVYDFIFDTTGKNPEETLKEILEKLYENPDKKIGSSKL